MDIQVNDISKIYGAGESRVTALHHANMQIRPGDFISIMGPSGSGKSTLLHIISGLDTPTSGQVLYGDADIHHGSDRELSAFRRRKIGFIFQHLRRRGADRRLAAGGNPRCSHSGGCRRLGGRVPRSHSHPAARHFRNEHCGLH